MMKRTIFSRGTLTPGLMVAMMFVLNMSVSAQYLVSTKAGFVNRADGKVYILRADSEDGQPGRASLGTQMREGDRLKTDADARAEILLNPGTYLRLNEKTEVRAVMTTFDQTRFELISGSAILEAGQIDKKTPIELVTPNGVISIAKMGLIRVDAKTGATWVAVRQGEIWLGGREVALSGKAEKVKRGKSVRLTGSATPELAKIDKDQIDAFDSWSFVRAQTLVQANLSSLRQNNTLAQGGWFYNSFFGCYTFVPYRGYLVSPYGFGFFRNWADCVFYDPFWGGYGYGYYPRGNNGGGVTTPSAPARVIAGVDREPLRREIPAERTINLGDNNYNRGDFGGRTIDTGSRSMGSVSSAPSAPAVISSPPPARSDSGGGGGALPTRGNNR